MSKNFDNFINNLTETIITYNYFVDFKKVFNNVKDLEYKLNNLNYLLGKEDFDNEFRKTFKLNPEVVSVLPILLAIREHDITVLSKKEVLKYDFKNYMNVEDYLTFIYETSLIEIFKDKRIRNLIDYVTGVEVGLDTNTRKNRTGTAMEDLVEEYLNEVSGITILKQARLKDIKDIFNINITLIDNEEYKNKRFDFIVKTSTNKIFLIETNYYRTSGSKLNEVARSYTKINEDTKSMGNIEFIWITDGIGWLSTKNDLLKAFNSIDHLYNINDLKKGILNNILL